MESKISRKPRGVALNAEAIREGRRSTGKTQTDLADAAKVSLDTVGRAERGQRISLAAAQHIATALNLELEMLIAESSERYLAISRIDFSDPEFFFEVNFFDLYEKVFDPIERDDPMDIVDWSLYIDIGQKRHVTFNDTIEYDYCLDSRTAILTERGRAIAFLFFTYDYRYKFIFWNFIAVDASRRSHGLARKFINQVEEVSEQLFPDWRGTVFEVETFDKTRVEEILGRLEISKNKELEIEERQEIRKLLRVIAYEGRGYRFFLVADKKEPLRCTAPCLDADSPMSEWNEGEEDYWLMWKGREINADRDLVREMFEQSVRCIYIEIIAKSAGERSSNGAEYWRYVNLKVDKLLEETKKSEITLGRYLRGEYELLRRWFALDVPIVV